MSYQPRGVKRTRGSSGFGGPYTRAPTAARTNAQKAAYAANRRFTGLHPWSTHGAARLQRGTDWNLESFGPSYKLASDAQKSNRLMTGYTGRGKYTFGSFIRDVESVGRRLEPTANRFLTKGMPRIARAVGIAKGMVGRGLYSGRTSGYSGSGMYSKNALIAGGTPTMSMMGGASDNQEVIISHHEYLQDVYGPADSKFSNNQLALNPGILENFPFLAQLAANYEEYEFIQLVFHFKSTVDASISSTGTTGTLIMATNYNADAPSFLSKESMMQYHGANNTRLDKDMDHGVECDPSKNAGNAIKFVRLTPLTDVQQKKEFDLGKFQWALVNIPSQFFNQQVGELWVTYTVKLCKPKLAVALGRTISEDRFITNGGQSTTSILGTNLLRLKQSNLGIVLSETSPGAGSVTLTVTFPNFMTGRFEVQIRKYVDGFDTAAPVAAGNVDTVSDIWTGAGYSDHRVFGTTGFHAVIVCHCDVKPATAGVDNTLTFACTNVTASEAEIVIRPYNPDLSLIWEDVSSGAVVVPT